MKFKRKIAQERGGLTTLDVVPLINVIFLLLIFFMFTSVFVTQPGIRVNIPKAITGEALYTKGLELIINENNEIFLNDRPISKDEILSLIRAVARDEKSVLIKADRRASLGKVVEIWDICRDEGVSEVNVATSEE